MTDNTVVPTHNEEAVIGDTLAPLSRRAAEGMELFVASNGCTDRIAEIAAGLQDLADGGLR